VVVARILVIADADQRLVQQVDHRGEQLAPGQFAGTQITFNALPQHRQGFAEFQHAAKL
jgi:hypothetical protein